MTKDERAVSVVFTILFAVYLFVLVDFTLISGYYGRITPAEGITIAQYSKSHTNLIPLLTVKKYLRAYHSGSIGMRYVLRNIAGNLAAFAPFGFFLPVLLKAERKLFVFLITLVFSILSIEAAQLLLMRGSFDIDDFILNFIGASVTFLISKALIKEKKQTEK